MLVGWCNLGKPRETKSLRLNMSLMQGEQTRRMPPPPRPMVQRKTEKHELVELQAARERCYAILKVYETFNLQCSEDQIKGLDCLKLSDLGYVTNMAK